MTDTRAHDALDAALDRLVQGLPAHAPEGLDLLVQTARVAREAFATEVPDAVARAHIAAMTGATMLERRRPRHRVAMMLIAAAVTTVLLAGGAVAASAGALPGQILYPVKRAVEKIDLAFHHDPGSRARLHLEFAQRRLNELATLLELRKAGQNVDIGAAMSAYQSEISQVQDAVAQDPLGANLQALLSHVQDELAGHVAVLTQLRDNVVPEQARDAIQNAIDRAETARANALQRRANGGQPADIPSSPPSSPGGPPSVNPGKSSTHH